MFTKWKRLDLLGQLDDLLLLASSTPALQQVNISANTVNKRSSHFPLTICFRVLLICLAVLERGWRIAFLKLPFAYRKKRQSMREEWEGSASPDIYSCVHGPKVLISSTCELFPPTKLKNNQHSTSVLPLFWNDTGNEATPMKLI